MMYEELLQKARKCVEELNADTGVSIDFFRVIEKGGEIFIEAARSVRLPFDEKVAKRWEEIDFSDLFEQAAGP